MVVRLTVVLAAVLLAWGVGSSVAFAHSDSAQAPAVQAAESEDLAAGDEWQTVSEDEAQEILRDTPINVPELIEKVKRGVVVVQPIEIVSAAAAEVSILGSGFVIDKQGHIITNAHVAGKSSVAQIIFSDGSSRRASVVAVAPYYDAALLKLDEPDPDTLFPVTLGDSDRVRAGEVALAMGSPGAMEGFNIDRSDPLEYWGLRQTATMRVVSGRDTDLTFEVMQHFYNRYQGGAQFGLSYSMNLPYIFRIQVPINQGNSGGPLFNRNGEVIAINTWGRSLPVAQQTNWAVPINFAKNFAVEVLEHKRHDIPWLGIHCIFPPNITDVESFIEFRELTRPEGLWALAVEKESPAALAGLQDGDQILSVNGQPPLTPEDFRVEVLLGEIGEEYVLNILRGNSEFEVRLYTVPKPAYVVNFSV